MLTIKNISYKNLFKNISFKIDKWVIWILGPSGSWKTTFLKIVWWFIKPNHWEILFQKWEESFKIQQWKIIRMIKEKQNNNQFPKFPQNSQISIWFHFQDYNLLDLDVKTNIDLPFIIWWYQKDEKWIKYLLQYFEIEHLINKDINEISWWEKERVSIVKALASKPKILLLDEAGAALDEYLKNKLYRFIEDYSKENIVLYISHDPNFISRFNLKKEIYNKNFKILKSKLK